MEVKESCVARAVRKGIWEEVEGVCNDGKVVESFAISLSQGNRCPLYNTHHRRAATVYERAVSLC